MTGPDFDEYAAIAAGYVLEQLRARGVPFESDETDNLSSMLRHGLAVAERSGEQHWELAFRGAVEALIDRVTFIARFKPGDLVPGDTVGSELFAEDSRAMRELAARIESGKPVSLMSICPLWPIC